MTGRYQVVHPAVDCPPLWADGGFPSVAAWVTSFTAPGHSCSRWEASLSVPVLHGQQERRDQSRRHGGMRISCPECVGKWLRRRKTQKTVVTDNFAGHPAAVEPGMPCGVFGRSNVLADRSHAGHRPVGDPTKTGPSTAKSGSWASSKARRARQHLATRCDVFGNFRSWPDCDNIRQDVGADGRVWMT